MSFRVVGRVQGVGFRAYVVRAAQSLGVTGWVRNDSDGSVVGEAWHDQDGLRGFRDALAQGPPWSHVESVAIRALERGEAPRDFGVRY